MLLAGVQKQTLHKMLIRGSPLDSAEPELADDGISVIETGATQGPASSLLGQGAFFGRSVDFPNCARVVLGVHP